MRLLLQSNAPWVPSGYGQQAGLFARLLAERGHQVAISAGYGCRHGVFRLDGVTVMPAGFDELGLGLLAEHYAHYKPDVALMLGDAWILDDELLRRVPLGLWAPVDHEPIPPAVARKLGRARFAIAMSRYGERQMRRVGLEPFYVPHGVDTAVFRPGDRKAAREAWGFPESAFVAVMVAENSSLPSRKNLDRVLKAWGRFVEKRSDALLYLHSMPAPLLNGLDLAKVATFYGLSPAQVRFADAYRLSIGDYEPPELANLYRAADVLLAPSRGEGFGIPVLEAQACGCPVVVTGFTAQRELCWGGHTIEVDPFDDFEYTPLDSEWANVRPSRILAAIEWAYDQRGNEALRAEAHAGAVDYDAHSVLDRHLLPVLEAAAQRLRGSPPASDAPPTPDAPVFGRRDGILTALRALTERWPEGKHRIVEIGGIRAPGNLAGDGNASLAWAWHARRVGGEFICFDVNQEAVENTLRLAQPCRAECRDGAEGLRALDPRTVHLVYLDGSDSPNEALAQTIEAVAKLVPGGLVMFDDVDIKAALAIRFLHSRGAQKTYDGGNQAIFALPT